MEHDDTKHSAVLIAVDEDADRTRACAHLSWANTAFVGMGVARMDAGDAHTVALRDEVAIARALSNLANQIFATSVSEIDAAITRHSSPSPLARR
ncbi:dsRBD fold-containing protein [Mycobacterium sp. EPa45]|uniref:dsRBD fold-containing protein n=1 Tax=Mycobacterium sp. EPa45 TaxID=1545728 RepID=UPI000641E1C8|nr:dsRBD fold-containing protein [Mycobacterium sp. EPa45]AKK28778.1 hypothetical protein AB431_21280 [Mycobacterium sp. EPa45]